VARDQVVHDVGGTADEADQTFRGLGGELRTQVFRVVLGTLLPFTRTAMISLSQILEALSIISK
jgi:hypothetical protein